MVHPWNFSGHKLDAWEICLVIYTHIYSYQKIRLHKKRSDHPHTWKYTLATRKEATVTISKYGSGSFTFQNANIYMGACGFCSIKSKSPLAQEQFFPKKYWLPTCTIAMKKTKLFESVQSNKQSTGKKVVICRRRTWKTLQKIRETRFAINTLQTPWLRIDICLVLSSDILFKDGPGKSVWYGPHLEPIINERKTW